MSHHEARKESSWKKFLVSGGVTLVFEGTIGHALEYLKIAKQTAPVGTPYSRIIKDIRHGRSIFALLDGFVPFGMIQAMTKGAVFGGAEVLFHSLLSRADFLGHSTQEILAGGLAGFGQGLALSPLLLLKTRVMTDPSMREVTRTPLQQVIEGSKLGARVVMQREIFKGSLVFASKRFADWTTRYFFASECEVVLFSGRSDLTSAEKIVAGLVGGTLSTLVTIPLDVIVAQVQDKKKAGQQVKFVESFMKNFKSGQLFAGLVPRILHVALTTAMLRTATSIVYKYVDR